MGKRRALIALAAVLPAVLLAWLVAWLVAPSRPDLPVRAVAEGLAFPTNLAFAPDGRMFFTEKDTGRVRVIQDGRVVPDPFVELPVEGGAERGLLGIALHPAFPHEPWVYLYLSDAADGRNRLVRVRAEGNRGVETEVLLDLLPAVTGYHNGGDLAFGPDGKLYLVTGEAHDPQRAQDPGDLGGKVLRLNPDGTIPPDNPFGPESPVFSMGLRNSFGLCFDPESGALWETENGPDAWDELNRIEAGANYGWPDHLGPGGGPSYVDPVLAFEEVIVPTGCAFLGGRLYFGDFRGDLHEVRPAPPGDPAAAGERVVARLGTGITDVAPGPDGALYVATASSILRVESFTADTSSASNEGG